jgi:hypothetical protein
VATGRELRRLDNPKEPYLSVDFSPNGQIVAAVHKDRSVHLWETATRREIGRFTCAEGPVLSLSFSTDGKTLACGNTAGTVLLWNLPAVLADGAPPARSLEGAWADLADAAPSGAYAAIASLAGRPEQAVSFLGERLKPAPAIDARRVARLLTDLDSEVFKTRQTAMKELLRLGGRVEPALLRTLNAKPSLEVRFRVKALLETLSREPISADDLRALRAVQVLERIGSAGAKRLLRTLSRGDKDAALTWSARTALAGLHARQREVIPAPAGPPDRPAARSRLAVKFLHLLSGHEPFTGDAKL